MNNVIQVDAVAKYLLPRQQTQAGYYLPQIKRAQRIKEGKGR
jgi:hypothetical protein